MKINAAARAMIISAAGIHLVQELAAKAVWARLVLVELAKVLDGGWMEPECGAMAKAAVG